MPVQGDLGITLAAAAGGALVTVEPATMPLSRGWARSAEPSLESGAA